MAAQRTGGRADADPLALPSVPPEAAADHRWRDGAVALLFGLALAAPLMGAVLHRHRTLTQFENRAAATWPAPPVDAASRRAWPAAFEAAFADRFGGRDRLIATHHALLARAFGVSPVDKVLIGRDGWLYFLGEDGKAVDRDWRGVVAYPADEPLRIAAEFKRRRDFLAGHGIAYVVAIVPDKATIYPGHLPAWARQPSRPTRLDRVYAALAAHPDVAAVDLRPPLLEAKAREKYDDLLARLKDLRAGRLSAKAGLDLIAELRRSAKGYLSPGAYAITVKEQLWLADWAEARLRDVSMSLSKGHDDE